MTKQNIALVIAGIVIGLILSAVVGSPAKKLGAVYELTAQHFAGGLYAGASDQFSVSDAGAVVTTGDATVGGGTLAVTTGASATSTAIAGCFQAYATSSATSIKLIFNSTATSSLINGGAINGFVLWQYGTCPNL